MLFKSHIETVCPHLMLDTDFSEIDVNSGRHNLVLRVGNVFVT